MMTLKEFARKTIHSKLDILNQNNDIQKVCTIIYKSRLDIWEAETVYFEDAIVCDSYCQMRINFLESKGIDIYYVAINGQYKVSKNFYSHLNDETYR